MDQFIIILLVLTSIVGVTFIVERGLALRWKKIIPAPVEAAVNRLEPNGDSTELRHACEDNPSPLSRLLLTADDHRAWPKAENADSLQTRARYEVTQMERGLVILEIVVGIAPLLGLVGTIYGLIILFRGMNAADFGSNAAVASGIALALRATLLGLLTAIPALIAWSYFSKKVETMAVEMETICDQFLRRIYRDRIEQAETKSPASRH
jgi:biopolymer transport protein ExbB